MCTIDRSGTSAPRSSGYFPHRVEVGGRRELQTTCTPRCPRPPARRWMFRGSRGFHRRRASPRGRPLASEERAVTHAYVRRDCGFEKNARDETRRAAEAGHSRDGLPSAAPLGAAALNRKGSPARANACAHGGCDGVLRGRCGRASNRPIRYSGTPTGHWERETRL